MKRRLKFYGFLFLLCFSVCLAAQEQRIDIQFLSVEDGLSNRRVNSICQSSDGFVWLATQYGLNRYDGQYFKLYNQKTHGFANDKIRKIFATKDNLLWLFYGNGLGAIGEWDNWSYQSLNIFDVEKEKLIPLSDIMAQGGSLPSGFRGGHTDEAGNLWLWTKSGEVFLYDGAWQEVFTLPDRGAINYVCPAGEGELWLAYGEKLLRLSEQGEILEEEDLSFYAEHLHQEDTGMLWISAFRSFSKLSPNDSFIYHKKKGESVKRYAISDEKSIIGTRKFGQYSSFRVDKKGRLWVHHERELELIDPQSQEITRLHPQTEAIANNRNFIEFYFGEDDLIFLGSDEGFFIIEIGQQLFDTYISDQSPTISTRAILDYSEDSLLVFTYGNTFLIHKENTGKQAIPSLSGLNFYGAILSRDSQIWAGSHSMLFTQIDPLSKEVKEFVFEQAPSFFKATLRPYEDLHTGRIWIGCSKGLAYYNPGEEFLQDFDPGSNFPDFNQYAVNGFYQNENGLWICTENGLYLYREGKGIVSSFNIFPYANINHIHEDKNQIFWLSTLGGGLIRWDRINNKIRQFTTEEGLSNDVVYAAFEDDYNQLWLPSNSGLMKFDKETYHLLTYYPSDGISHEEFNNTSYCRTADGRFYFGGINGVNGFDPKDMAGLVLTNAKLVITDFKKSEPGTGHLLDAKADFDLAKGIRIEPGEGVFQLHYSLLDYKGKQQISYAYWIEGINAGWAYHKDNFIRLNRLPYGNYKLHLKGQGGGKWSENTLEIGLKFVKPLHRKAWFIALIALLAFGLGGYLVRWRIRFLKKEKMMLEQEVRRRTVQINEQKQKLEAMNDTKDQFFGIIAHDLRGPMLSFRGLSKKFRYLIANNQAHRLEELEQSVEEAYQRLDRLLDNLLKWALVQKGNLPFYPKSLELHEFTREIVSLYEELARVNGITIVNAIGQPTMAFADADALSSVIRNLLNNAIKFSPEGSQITIRAHREGELLRCEVEDQGSGIAAEDLETLLDFDPQKRRRQSEKGGTGLGLQLCKELVELHDGHMKVESEQGKGTLVTFFIPYKNA